MDTFVCKQCGDSYERGESLRRRHWGRDYCSKECKSVYLRRARDRKYYLNKKAKEMN